MDVRYHKHWILFASLILVLAFPALLIAQNNLSEKIVNPTLIEHQLETRDYAPVIIQLNTDYRPEARLSQRDINFQRDRIRNAQNQILREIREEAFENVRMFQSIPYISLFVNATEFELLASHEMVARIFPDELSKPMMGETVGIIGADQAWELGFTGAGQAVVVLDTGSEVTHEFLSDAIVAEACFSVTNASFNSTSLCPEGVGFSNAEGSGTDCDSSISGCGHGTHVAGTVAGRTDDFFGVAKEAKLIPIQVFSRFDDPDTCGDNNPCVLSFNSSQLAALEYVHNTLSEEFTIASINMSIGGGRHTQACDDDPRKAIIDALIDKDIATIIASGNDGFTNAISGPACISSAISVGAVTKADNVANFSNSSSLLNILAPGVAIYSSDLNNSYSFKQGTSMAAPHVAGAWALLKQAFPDASVSEIHEILVETGVSITDPRNNLQFKRIQVDQAILENLEGRDVVFSVNMTAQKSQGAYNPDNYEVRLAGNFTDWGNAPLLMQDENGDGVYRKTVSMEESPGTKVEYKFILQRLSDGEITWENDFLQAENEQNRFFELGPSGTTMVLETPFFNNDENFGPPTARDITFRVNMDNVPYFDEDNHIVHVTGPFANWGANENYALEFNTDTGFYELTASLELQDFSTTDYKFMLAPGDGLPNSGWEKFEGNRSFMVDTNTELKLDEDYFNFYLPNLTLNLLSPAAGSGFTLMPDSEESIIFDWDLVHGTGKYVWTYYPQDEFGEPLYLPPKPKRLGADGKPSSANIAQNDDSEILALSFEFSEPGFEISKTDLLGELTDLGLSIGQAWGGFWAVEAQTGPYILEANESHPILFEYVFEFEDKFIIFEEDFENINEFPQGWTTSKATNNMGQNLQPSQPGEAQWILYKDGLVNNFNPNYVRSGDASAFVTWNVQAIGNAYLSTPEITIPAFVDFARLEFWKWFANDMDDGWFTVFSILAETADGFTQIASFNGENVGNNIYESPVTVSLEAFQGQTIRLHFIQEWNDGFQLAIDDISIYGVAGEIPLPDQITLISPEDNAELVSVNPVFEWESDVAASSYTLEIAEDNSFSDIFETVNTENTSTELTQTLEYGRGYVWRVRGSNETGDGPWSDVRSFITKEELPGQVVLTAPQNGEQDVDLQPVFEWEHAEGAAQYQLQLSESHDFSSTVWDTTVVTVVRQYTATLKEGHFYYWRVRAENSSGYSDWSSVFEFETQVLTSAGADDVPINFGLSQNYPNPFNPVTVIRYQIATQTDVKLQVFDILGREIIVLANGPHEQGYYEVSFDGRNLSSGIYIYRLTAGSYSTSRQMLVVR